MTAVADIAMTLAEFLRDSFLLLAPMLLLGLFLSGLIHVLISRQAILRWFKDDSLKSVCTSAAIGVPMPLCSCSVVPVVAEMRSKGASRSSCMSFLITAPETGADSILVTNAFFGPVVAFVRPLISFVTAVVAGAFCIGMLRDEPPERRRTDDRPASPDAADHRGADDDCCEHGAHTSLFPGRDDCYVSPAQLRGLAGRWLKGLARSARPPSRASLAATFPNSPPPGSPDFPTVVKHAFRYGFVDVADDILFAMLVGIFLGGMLYLALPQDLMANEYATWLAYPVILLVGVPLYICASASTPIAAALVAKGVSPGAALVFLMTGPATNTTSIAIIVGRFGARFASIYVSSVVAVTLVLGILVDILLLLAGMTIPVHLGASDHPTIMALQWGGAIALVALIAWRFQAGALRSGYDEFVTNLLPRRGATRGERRSA